MAGHNLVKHDALIELAELIAEPLLVFACDGKLIGANQAAKATFPFATHPGAPLSELVLDPPGPLLAACRAQQTIEQNYRWRTATGEVRCTTAATSIGSDGERLLVLRCTRLGAGVGTAHVAGETEAGLAARLRQQAAVAELGQLALGGMEEEPLLEAATSLVVRTLNVDFAKVMQMRPDGSFLFRAGTGWQTDLRGQVFNESQSRHTVLTRNPVISENLPAEERFRPPAFLTEHGVISTVSVVIWGPGEAFGALEADSREPRKFTGDDINFLQAIANLLALVLERKQAEHALVEQQVAVRQLSTPVLQVRDQLLIVPLIGVMNADRARQLTEQLLASVRRSRAKAVVIDLTGVPTVDTAVANHLIQTVSAARLLGARTVVTGISREIAQTLVDVGIGLAGIYTLGDLQSGIEQATRWLEEPGAMMLDPAG